MDPPPSSWRNAAWSVVAITTVVLIVLVFTAVRLAGPDRRFGRIDAFPGLPTGGLLTPERQEPQASEQVAAPAPTRTDERRTTTARQSQLPGGAASVPAAPGEGRPGEQPPPPGQSGSGGGGGSGSPLPTSVPSQPTSQPSSPAPTHEDPDVVEITQLFFGYLPGDLQAAWDLTGPRVRILGFEEFSRVWGQYRLVRLLQVTVGADGVTVVATIEVTEHKGAISIQRWKLTYLLGESPLIDQASMLASDPQDPGGNRPFR